MTSIEIAERVRVFLEEGLLQRVPTLWQLHQGELQMTPYVISTDATAEEGYLGAPLGHPLVRQPIIFSQVGPDHLRLGSALGARLSSLCAHLQLTYHRGMPVFDLQAVQTHPDGLNHLRQAMEEMLTGATPLGRRRRRIAALIIGKPDVYIGRFLGDDGWIARAERFDYPSSEDEGALFPAEFFSLVGFLDYCAATFPAEPRDVAWARLPGHLLGVVGRRFREGRGFGWFASRGGEPS